MKQLVCTILAFFMFSLASVKNAYSWSIFSADLTGEWVQDGGLIPMYLTFYPDGKLKISGFTNYSYKARFSEVEITVTSIWGTSSTGTHKYFIKNGILSFNPGIYGAEHFKRSK